MLQYFVFWRTKDFKVTMNGGCHMRGSHYNFLRSRESEASSQRFLIVNGVSALFSVRVAWVPTYKRQGNVFTEGVHCGPGTSQIEWL